MSNSVSPFEMICPLCNERYVNCISISCDVCAFTKSSECSKECNCKYDVILKELQSQIYQLQIENESLLHERNVWKIFITEKGE